MNKKFRIASLFLIASFLLGACASPGIQAPTEAIATTEGAPTEAAVITKAPEEPTATTAPTTEPTPTEADATPEATPTPKPLASKEGTLTIWVDGGRVQAITDMGKQFTEAYNVPVAVQELGFGDVRDQLKIAGPPGEGPDIIIGAHDWLGELVTNGLLEPLDLGDKAQSFDPVSLQAFTYNGQLYGVPYAVEAIALVYNKDVSPEPPMTWEEMKEIARNLQEQGDVEQGYVLHQGDPYHTYPIITGFGGYVFGRTEDDSYNPEDLGLDNPGAIAAAEEIDSMIKEGLLRKDVNYEIMMTLFKEGKSAFFIGGPWTLTDLRSSGVNYGIAKIPTMEQTPRPFVGVQGFMVSAFGENKLLAQAFLTEYLASDEAMQALYQAVPNVPAWLPLRETLDDADLQMFAESAADGEPMPAIPQMSAVWEAWGKAITIIFQQQQPADQAMKDAAQTIRETIAGSQ
ncbi:MAG: maltose/maltodextrin ABC transporter substrate-binding protein MalE [Anaerolineales bacterium]|nr:maltose/maltodextrin ABC transporter substrate-binding protein MalE [Anaerolineales bacterium]